MFIAILVPPRIRLYWGVLALNASKCDKPLGVLKNHAKAAGYRDKPCVRGFEWWAATAPVAAKVYRELVIRTARARDAAALGRT